MKNVLKILKKNIVGKIDGGGNKGLGVSRTPIGSFAFSNNFIPIYITSEKEVTRGVKKGQMKETTSTFLLQTNFCGKCGKKICEDEQDDN